MDQYLGEAILLLILMVAGTLCWAMLRTLPTRQSPHVVPVPAPQPTAQERLMLTRGQLERLRIEAAELPDGHEATTLLLELEAGVDLAEGQLQRDEFVEMLVMRRA